MPDRSWVPDSLNYSLIPDTCECGSCADSYGAPDCQYRKYLLGVIRRVKNTHCVDITRVFGSVVTGKERPGDIDVLIDLDTPAWNEKLEIVEEERVLTPEEKKSLGQVLKLAEAAYGALDPFFRLNGELWVRNETATGWIRAKNAKKIYREACRSGVPVKDIYNLPFVADLT